MAISPERREARRRNLALAAQALIRERGDAGFSMAQLAERAGVSPATPYNLVGSKAGVLALVVGDEFERFAGKLAGLAAESPLRRLMDAVALVARHYDEDRGFYRGLFGAALQGQSADINRLMLTQGRALWRDLIQAAIDAGELDARAQAAPLTDTLLRTITMTTLAWLGDDWPRERFDLEMGHASGLIFAAVAAPALREALRAEVLARQAALAADHAEPGVLSA